MEQQQQRAEVCCVMESSMQMVGSHTPEQCDGEVQPSLLRDSLQGWLQEHGLADSRPKKRRTVPRGKALSLCVRDGLSLVMVKA